MTYKFENYPITEQALLEVRKSYDGVYDADAHAIALAERVADILETTLDVPANRKDSLMAVGVLLYMEGNISGPKAIDAVERCEHPVVTETVYEIWKGNDISREEKPNKEILQIFTAVQTARYEHTLYDILTRSDITPDLLRKIKSELASHQMERNTSNYADIGADKLQLLEINRRSGLENEIDSELKVRAPALAPVRITPRKPS